jgi:DNA (cytosine-5)-methyltransferase 1
MRHGSLFSGIGGFDLAAQWMNWTNVFHTEWNEFGQKILQHHFPNSISYHDIIKTDFTIHNGTIDIITGGFPCQPFSHAGKRKGSDDERYLWHEMLRAIQQIQPTYVVAENVRGLLTIDDGMVFEQVCADLEAEGYEVQPLLLPAAGVNAPHRRDRIFIVGYAANTNDNRNSSQGQSEEAEGNRCRNNAVKEERQHKAEWTDGLHGLQPDAANTNGTDTGSSNGRTDCETEGNVWRKEKGNVSGTRDCTEPSDNTKEIRLQRSKQADSSKRQESNDQFIDGCCGKRHSSWEQFPTQSAICSRNDGLSDRLDNITFPKWRNESIKAYGNAVVPQLILPIFQTIEKLYREET